MIECACLSEGRLVVRRLDLTGLRKPAFFVEAVDPILMHTRKSSLLTIRLYSGCGGGINTWINLPAAR
jgi:hypothetical protein